MQRNVIYHIVRMIVVTIFLIGSTIMWYYKYQEDETLKNIVFNQDITFVEKSDGIKLTNAYPLSDDEIDELKGYQFELKKKKKGNIAVTIGLVKNAIPNEAQRLDNTFLKYQVIKNGDLIVVPTIVPEDGVLFTDVLEEDSTYEIKLWLSSSATNDAMVKYFSSKIALL